MSVEENKVMARRFGEDVWGKGDLDAMTEPAVRVHENTRSTVEQLARERSWMNSPVGRGGVRT